MKTLRPERRSRPRRRCAHSKQLEPPRHVWLMVPVREDHGGHVPEAARHRRARRHDRRRRQLELRDSQRRCGGAQARIAFVGRRLRRDLGARGRLLPDGRRRQGSGGSGCARSSTRWRRRRLGARRHLRGRPLHEDGPQRDRVRPDAAYAEGFELMHHSEFELDLSEIAGIWRYGSVVRSWLLELLHEALEQHGDHLDEIALRRGLRRGPLDDQRGDRRQRAGAGDQRRSSRASPPVARSTSRPRCRAAEPVRGHVKAVQEAKKAPDPR